MISRLKRPEAGRLIRSNCNDINKRWTRPKRQTGGVASEDVRRVETRHI